MEESDICSSSSGDESGDDITDDEGSIHFEEEVNIDDALERELLSEKRYLVCESALLTLIRNQRCRESSCGKHVIPETIKKTDIPSGIKYTFSCGNGHECKWMSSSYYGARCFVHQLIQMAILISGLTLESVHLFFMSMNVSFGSSTNFFSYQRLYSGGIQSYFSRKQDEAINKMKDKESIIIVDTRYDSPGFCASKGTTIFMDHESNQIVHIEVGHSKEAGGSSKLEGFLFEKGLDYLLENGVRIKEVVTDASKTLISILEKPKYMGIMHSLDVWHKAKKINEKIGLDSKRAENKALRPWIRFIVNHFWWCCKTAKGSITKIRTRWLSLLSHIQNIHEWTTGHCHHDGHIEAPNGCSWLQDQSAAFKCLRSHVQDRFWLSSLKYYVNGRTTWRLENFNSHSLLRYCPKRLSFSYDTYRARNELAVLDFNAHVNRGYNDTSCGEPSVRSQQSRRTKEWVAYRNLKEKQYSYLQDLMCSIMRQCYGQSVRRAKLSQQSTALSIKNGKPKTCDIWQKKKSRLQ